MPDKSSAPLRAWQRMLSGRRLDLLDPSPLDIEISDIAHGLARVARWNGQTTGPNAFSVAQHSLAVEAIFSHQNQTVDIQWQLYALLHDAPEYVIGDMISPFKSVIGDAYKGVEKRLEEAIHLRFGLPREMPGDLKQKIKKADLACAYFEALKLAGFTDSEADQYFGRPRGVTVEMIDLNNMSVQTAEKKFLHRFNTLSSQMAQAIS